MKKRILLLSIVTLLVACKTEHKKDNIIRNQHTIEEKIKEYPALALQYHRFIELYNLCKDDYYSGKQNDELF